jgi:type I restriction enzyme S subunit
MREGWKSEILKDCCNVFTDGNWIESKDQSTEGIRLVQTGNIGFGFFKDKEDKARYISEDTFKRLKCTEILAGDLLVSRLPDPVGKSCIIPDLDTKMITGVDCTIIRPKEYLSSEYLGYFQQSDEYLRNVLSKVSGTTRSRISRKNLGIIKIPIPPLSEQKQIVEILDEAFTGIDQAKANIEKNILNAKELFQSKLNEIFSQKGDGWEKKNIEEISTVVNGYSFKSKDFSSDNEVKSIKITNVGIMEFVEDSSNNLPAAFLHEHSKVKVHEGDLVLALTRTIISGGLKVARVPESYHNSLLNQRVAAIVPKTDFVDRDYLYYYFSSDIVYNYVLDNVNTLMQPNLSIGDLKKMPVPITSIEGQRKISVQIENLSEKTNLLISNYGVKLNDLEKLKKSILQKAFAGELTNKMAEV